MNKATSGQVKKRHIPNPTGVGGFKDNPQNRTAGVWRPENTISYQYKRFLNMTTNELIAFAKLPDDQKTVAMDIAYAQVIRSRKSLPHAKEVTDRTEGKSPQAIDVTSGGEKIQPVLVEFIGDDATEQTD